PLVPFLGVRTVLADARADERVCVALANPSRDRRWYQIVASCVAHDSDLAATELITNRRVDHDTLNPGAIDKIVVFAVLDCRHSVLFDQLLDLSQLRLPFRRLLSLPVQRLVASGLCTLRGRTG